MPESLDQWLQYIGTLRPEEIKLGLERVALVAERLGGLQPACPVVMVAGTNGKGSLVRLLESLLQQQGRRVGCYTSPHLVYFNERIRVDGQVISDQDLLALFNQIEAARADTQLTFFEFTTLAALLYFRQQSENTTPLDVVVLEVGLGGRLDAVNIVDPDISVMTTIGLDHTDWLGDSLAQIGVEKAGICRPNRPMVCGIRPADLAASVVEYLAKQEARLVQLGRDFDYQLAGAHWRYQGQEGTFEDLPQEGLPVHSQALCLQVLTQLQTLGVGQGTALEKLAGKLSSVTLAGRMQQLEYHAIGHILDVAHNQDSATYLAKKLPSVRTGRVHAVFSVLEDKDLAAIVSPLVPLVDSWAVAGLPGTCRGQSGRAIATAMKQLPDVHLPAAITEHDSVTQAHAHAIAAAAPGDTILVLGSFYTVAEVLQVVGDQDKNNRNKVYNQ